jgi:hypothetical protein
MKLSLIAAILVLGISSAHAATLDFGNDPAAAPTICSGSADGSGAMVGCTTSNYINQGYGDVTGVVDVTYSQPLMAASLASLRWWDTSYNDLFGVLWAEGGDGPLSHARIELKPLDGNGIRLTHFDFGAYSHTTRHTLVDVYAIGSSVALFTFDGNVGADPNHTSFDVNVFSANGLWIDWRDSAYNVGIDNVAFNSEAVGQVPEPTTLVLLGLGLAGVGFRARKRTEN